MAFTKGHKINVGRKLSEETRKKIGAANKAALTGRTVPAEVRAKISATSKGRVLSEETRQKLRESKRGAKAYNWKGDEVGYLGLHHWVERELGRPSLCEHCETTTAKRFDWANKSNDYKRELSDWLRLCRSCHMKYDSAARSRKGPVHVSV